MTFGPEAMFPVGTELNVREILPDSAEYRELAGITDDMLSGSGNEVGEFARFFDITFLCEGEEIEPQAPIDVQITFHDAISVEGDSDIQMIHFAEEGAEIIDSNTDSTDSAVGNDAAVDTVSFTSGAFSVYGVVSSSRIKKTAISASGQTYSIEVTYDKDANIPQDADLEVTEILPGSELYELYRQQVAATLEADDVKLSGLFDITIVSNGEKIQPDQNVSVSIKLLEEDAIQQDDTLHVVHFTDETPSSGAVTASEETFATSSPFATSVLQGTP